MEFSDKMGDSRPEGERNFWNGREAVTAKGGPYVAKKPKNELEAEDMKFEGGSDLFTTNRHTIHNSCAEYKVKFWSSDDAPVIRPLLNPRQVYSAPTVRVMDGYGGEGCEKVTKLMLRSNNNWIKQSLVLAAGGLAVFAGIVEYKKRKGEASPSVPT
ncbi:uncharacterized protein LOC111716955 [Eurytemora carolleeae]|uniref:uncharacterized protein LOC111716955 n=1 Tax=Eurytemora carolleeae TaxID=1294199 RepID=UPI000C76946B|nr:uncharacterized protein LOC111716955 [Eurytemora carolleeae]|eukprot:XP_023348236.1 uncharacterized protein LOC111716955 [Eurytemora affinis]